MVPPATPLILVVEDDPGVAVLQRRRLERAGFAVDVSADVATAMSRLTGGAVDLVVMDYRLGTTTGLDLHRRMKAMGSEVPVIIVSGTMDDALVIEAIRTGIRDVIVKSTDYLDYLPEAVRGVLSQAAAVPDRRAHKEEGAWVLIVDDDLGTAMLAREPLPLSQIVTRAADGVRDAVAEHGLALDVRVGPEPTWLNGDATRLEQVLSNLLNNSIKFTPAGGRITLEAGRDGGEAVIRVRDTGVGIESALLPKVFDLFVQADTSLDRSKSGLGIGLALVRQTVTLHGGQVAAFSAGAGEGAEFVVRLHAAPEGAARPQEHASTRVRTGQPMRILVVDDQPARPQEHASTRVRTGQPMRILVVDDQPDVADAIVLLIGTLGHDARAVYDGAAGLAAGRSEPPDVMFVDIGMPGMTGYELARRARQDDRLSQVQLVALTGYGRDEDRSRALAAGFDLHLTKPVTDATLQQVLEAVADAASDERRR